MFERKHTAQHDTAPRRRARHRTARLRTALSCAAAGLYIYIYLSVYSRSDQSWACIVVQQHSTWWYVQTWCSSMYYKPQGLLVGSNPGVIGGKKMILIEKIIDINVTLWSSSRYTVLLLWAWSSVVQVWASSGEKKNDPNKKSINIFVKIQ